MIKDELAEVIIGNFTISCSTNVRKACFFIFSGNISEISLIIFLALY